jgi:hypothetical protein
VLFSDCIVGLCSICRLCSRLCDLYSVLFSDCIVGLCSICRLCSRLCDLYSVLFSDCIVGLCSICRFCSGSVICNYPKLLSIELSQINSCAIGSMRFQFSMKSGKIRKPRASSRILNHFFGILFVLFSPW